MSNVRERWDPVIGLEVHAQLNTQSKLFSPVANRFDPEHPNSFTDPYVLGMPGVLPVVNRAAVELAARAGLALNCKVHSRSIWARKQYFYPDSPKGYQITQHHFPICTAGYLDVDVGNETRHVRIERIHMEEDAGKSSHHADGRSRIDLNRSGTPLVEIVSMPDLKSGEEAAAYLKELRSILVTLGVSLGNLEEGSFRCDANVSIRPVGTEPLGVRTELKNINSFRYVAQAIEIEIERQARLLERGDTISRETRLYDSEKRQTRTMRSKENEADYRYFPDPDLPPLILAQERIDELQASQPELPQARRARWQSEYELPEDYARAFVEDPAVAQLFDEAAKIAPKAALVVANAIKSEVLRQLNEDDDILSKSGLAAVDLAELAQRRTDKKISSTQEKKILVGLLNGQSLDKLFEEHGTQVADEGLLNGIIADAITKNPDAVAEYKKGKTQTIGFFVGQVMRATKGRAPPEVVRELLTKALDEA